MSDADSHPEAARRGLRTGSETIRRAGPDPLAFLVVVVVFGGVAVLASGGMRVLGIFSVTYVVVDFVVATVYRPAMVLDPDGITAGWGMVWWTSIEEVRVFHGRGTSSARIRQMDRRDVLVLPAPVLRRGDFGSALEQFDAGLAELARWLAAYAPQARMLERVPPPFLSFRLSKPGRVGGFVSVGIGVVFLIYLARR